jgi:hypothetical protein
MCFVYSENTHWIIFVYFENMVKLGYIKKTDRMFCAIMNESFSEECTVMINGEKLNTYDRISGVIEKVLHKWT